MFIEQMLPGVTQRKLTEEEMTEYRRPFLEPGLDLSATITVFKSLIPLEHVSTI
jgi:haloalkane dehalogenase